MEHPIQHLMPPAAPAAVPAPIKRGPGRPKKDPSAPKPPPPAYPRVLDETADTVPTPQAAFYVRRSVATLQAWALLPDAPIKPIRVRKGAPLLWPMAGIRELLGIA